MDAHAEAIAALKAAAEMAWSLRWDMSWDMNHDNVVDLADLWLLTAWFFFAPGDAIQQAHALAQKYNQETLHTLHVTALAVSLFDQLRELHHLDRRSRQLLECAGLLHDLGEITG